MKIYSLIIRYLCLVIAGFLLPTSSLAQLEPCSVELIGICNGSADCSGSLSGGMEITNTGTTAITCNVVSVFSDSEPVGTGGIGVGGFETTVELSPGQSSMVFGWIDIPIGEIPFWEFHPFTESGTSTADCYVTDNPAITCNAYQEWECSATCDPIPVAVGTKISSISATGKGLLSFIIMGADDFDVTAVDPATIRLGRDGVRDMIVPLRWSYKSNDMWVKFNKSEVASNLKLGEVAGQKVQLFITGKLKDEFGKTPFMGAVSISVVQ